MIFMCVGLVVVVCLFLFVNFLGRGLKDFSEIVMLKFEEG